MERLRFLAPMARQTKTRNSRNLSNESQPHRQLRRMSQYPMFIIEAVRVTSKEWVWPEGKKGIRKERKEIKRNRNYKKKKFIIEAISDWRDDECWTPPGDDIPDGHPARHVHAGRVGRGRARRLLLRGAAQRVALVTQLVLQPGTRRWNWWSLKS